MHSINREIPNIVEHQVKNVARFKIVDDRLSRGNGVVFPYSYVDIDDGVILLPILIDEKTGEKRILVIEQYRHPMGEWCLELPAGHIDRDETPEMAAERELLEETGYRVIRGSVVPLGTTYPDIGACTECIYLFAGEVEKSLEMPHYDPGEQIVTRILSVDEFSDEIKKQKITCTSFEVLWYRWLRKLKEIRF